MSVPPQAALRQVALRPVALRQEAMRRFRSNPAAVVSIILIAGIVVLSIAGPWFTPNGDDTLDWLHVATRPGLPQAHWFGTDRLGRDLFVRTLEGTRVSLAVGLVASAVSLLVGISYGAVAGYLGGRIDHLMMRIIEIISGLPLIFFVIFITVTFGRNIYILFLSIGAVAWLTMARIVRGQTMSIRRQEYIEAAVACGATPARIILRHVLPNLVGVVVVYATLSVPQVILFESFLSFLGLGIQEPNVSLGTLVADGAGELEAAPWILLIPGAFLALLMLCLNICGDGLRDALDVKEN
jgi:oligopeptide transport system permease protein